MGYKKIKQPKFTDTIIEERMRNRKYWRIGWAIMHMKWYERLWWAFGGKHKYLTHEFWDKQK